MTKKIYGFLKPRFRKVAGVWLCGAGDIFGGGATAKTAYKAWEDKIWHKGRPPSVGWWLASSTRSKGILRWWDGRRWSVGVHWIRNAKFAGNHALRLNSEHEVIEWIERPEEWPDRSLT